MATLRWLLWNGHVGEAGEAAAAGLADRPLAIDPPALDAGSTDLALTRLGRSSSTVYDSLGRVVQQISVDPDGIGSEEASVTSYTFDAGGSLLTETDPLGNVTEYQYDNLGRKTSETDPEEGVTTYTYDSVGRMTSLTDPEENTTYWSYSPLGQVATETINVDSTDLVRYYSYDARGNLTRKIDRNGRVIDYAYDSLSRQTTETWYDDVTDADAQQDAVTTYATTYDEMGRVATIGDGDYDFEYTWSIFGNLTSTTQDLTGLTDDVVFNYTYDVLGRQTSVAATIGSTDDYVNTYSYDNLGRITQITQSGTTGGNAVAEKRVDYAYNDDFTRATISRYADLAGTTAVAETEKVFDELGRVTDIVHERAATEFADYDLTWDAAGELTDFDFESLVGDYGETSYTYDDTGQLTGADYTSDWQDDESYVYDDNGNRTLVDGTTSYTTGDHNRLTSDGTYNYTYDGEGNVLTKTNISTGESVQYTWDHRNRLTKVTYKNSGGTATKIVEYAYDHGQRWVRKTLDTDADGTIEESQVFVHSGGQIVLDFQKTGTGDAGNSDLAHRYLWGGSVDDLLADETVDDGTGDDVAWALTDHLHSVRDVVVYDPTTQTVSVVKHVTYDAYGNVTSDTATTVDTLFLYTARPFDADTELQNNRARWYDATTGRWLSTDPIGFAAGDVNLYRYVGNSALWLTDPNGLAAEECRKSCGVDVTDWLVAQMNKNVTNDSVKKHKEAVEKSDEAMEKAIIALLWGDTKGAKKWFAIAAKYEALRLKYAIELVNLVRGGQPWDFKAHVLADKNLKCPDEDCVEHVSSSTTLCGKCVSNDLAGNIHYGYIFHAAGFDYFETTFGPGLVQKKPHFPFDDPHDTAAIDIGWSLLDKGPVTAASLCTAVKAKKDDLILKGGEPCGSAMGM